KRFSANCILSHGLVSNWLPASRRPSLGASLRPIHCRGCIAIESAARSAERHGRTNVTPCEIPGCESGSLMAISSRIPCRQPCLVKESQADAEGAGAALIVEQSIGFTVSGHHPCERPWRKFRRKCPPDPCGLLWPVSCCSV